MILHLITSANGGKKGVPANETILSDNDAIVLLADGCYCCSEICELLQKQNRSNNVYVLKPDVMVRGLVNQLPEQTQTIDYQALVELTLKAEKSITWH